MAKPKKNKKVTKNVTVKGEEAPTKPPVPISAVPHLFNESMLAWQQSQFNVLKGIHEKLDEILTVLKEE